MTAVNSVTGDRLVSKTSSDAYRDRYDAIFGKKKKAVEVDKEDTKDSKDKDKDKNNYP